MRRSLLVTASLAALLAGLASAISPPGVQDAPAAPAAPTPPADVTAASPAQPQGKAAVRPAAAESACITCHADPARVPRPELRDPVASFADDIHRERGLSCHDCHGGRPDVDLADGQAAALSHDALAGFRGRPAPADVPAFCGRCHSDAAFMGRFNPDARVDQEAKYRTSVHGKKLAEGDTKVANCLSCHGRHPAGEKAAALAHGIRPVGDPRAPVYPLNVATTCGRCHADAEYMQSYGIATDQLALYGESVHHAQMVERDDLSAPTCNDCHGNHGAHPPEVEDTSYVCGTCHLRQAELFRSSTMKPAFDEMGLGECIVCHSNHRIRSPSDELLFHEPLAEGATPSGCWTCHPDPEDAALASTTTIFHAIRGLDERIGAAHDVIREAGAKGMPVSDAEFRLTGANDALVEARALVHGFRAAEVEAAANKGIVIADDAMAMGRSALADFFFRNRWLAVSLVGIAVVIVSLLLKVRQVDRRWRDGRPSAPSAASGSSAPSARRPPAPSPPAR